MRLLARYRPKIIGSTFTEQIRHGTDIDVHVFAASTKDMESSLEAEGSDYRVERKVVRKHGEERVFTHIHINDRFPIELTTYVPDKASFAFKSSVAQWKGDFTA